MAAIERPSAGNGYHKTFVRLLDDSYRLWTGNDLVPGNLDGVDSGRYLFHAPFAVLAHSAESDPKFTYANNKAMKLFRMEWESIVGMPSRLSAEAANREQRERLLKAVNEKGFIDDYSGVRIASDGTRFSIINATIWNLVDIDGEYAGQAAMIADWKFLSSADAGSLSGET